jgi:hypothetical protein
MLDVYLRRGMNMGVCSALSSLVVGVILAVFTYHLHADGYKLPYSFLVVRWNGNGGYADGLTEGDRMARCWRCEDGRRGICQRITPDIIRRCCAENIKIAP